MLIGTVMVVMLLVMPKDNVNCLVVVVMGAERQSPPLISLSVVNGASATITTTDNYRARRGCDGK